MDKKFQTVKSFITRKENRIKIAAIAGVTAIVAGIVTYTAKRGKKRK